MRNVHTEFHAINVAHNPESIHETFHVSLHENAELYVSVGFSEVRDEALCKNTMYSMVQSLQNSMYSDTHADLYDRFEEAIKILNNYLHKRNLEEMGRLALAVGLLEGTSMHITKTGLAEIYLIRKNTYTNVTAHFDETLDFEDAEEGEIGGQAIGEVEEQYGERDFFNNIASGDLMHNDIILISSNRLTKYLEEKELLSYFGKGNLEVGCINLEHKLKSEPDPDISLIAFKVQVDGVVEEVLTEEESNPMYTPSPSPKEPFSWKDLPQNLQLQSQKFLDFHKKALENPDHRKKYITLGALLVLIILVVSITTSLSNSQNDQFKVELKQKYTEAKNELATAKNNNIKGDREGARASLESAKRLTLELKDQNIAAADINALLDEITKEEDIANKVVRVENDKMFIDVANQIQNDAAKGIIHYDGKLFVFSSTALYGPFINADTNANKKVTPNANDLILDAAYFDDIRGIILKLTPDKVAEFVEGSLKYTDTTAVTWKAGNHIDTYGSNLYVLGDDQIWRYTKNKDAYRGPSPWLQKSEPELKNAVSFALDGAIYTLMNNGTIKKYFRNKLVDGFSLVDVPAEALSGVDDMSHIMTRQDWKRVYVLNHALSKVVALTKVPGKDQLAFEKQFTFPNSEIIHIAISQDETTIYALSKDLKIYKVDIQ